MKGISSGVAVILLIIITIILTGITLMFISNQFPDPTATAEITTSRTSRSKQRITNF